MILTRRWRISKTTGNEAAARYPGVSLVHLGRSQAQQHSAPGDIEKLVSAGSVWEMAIKVSLGKLVLSEPFAILIPRELARNGFSILPLDLAHAARVATMPFHHRDPFDRLLIAQAQEAGLEIISSDVEFDSYGVKRLW